jgi:hypothetical protein
LTFPDILLAIEVRHKYKRRTETIKKRGSTEKLNENEKIKAKNMKKVFLFFFGIIIPLLIGCSKPLSREEAANAIKQKYNLPYNETQDFQFTQYKDVSYNIPFHYMAVGSDAYNDEHRNFTKRKEAAQKAQLGDPPKLPTFETLEREGLITYTIQILNTSVAEADGDLSSPGNLSAEGVDAYGGIFYDFKCTRSFAHIATLTEEGKKYITNNNTVITSTYEFGEITGIVERKEFNTSEVNYTIRRTNITPFGRIVFNINEETYNRTETFTKYDDGWRINQ